MTSSLIDSRHWEATITLKNGSVLNASAPQHVTFDIAYYPNTSVGHAEISFYGFDRNTIYSIIEQGSRIKFAAGYQSGFERIFYGVIRNVHHIRSGVDNYIRVFATSVSQDALQAILSKTWGPGTPYLSMLNDAIDAMNGTLNLIPHDATYWRDRLGYAETSGFTFADYAIRLAQDLASRSQSMLYSYSADGQLQSSGIYSQFYLCAPGYAATNDVHIITPETGMEGSLTYIPQGVIVATRLNSAMHPCDRFRVESEYYAASAGNPYEDNQRMLTANTAGEYYAETITHRGMFEGDVWTTSIVGRTPYA